MARDYRYGHKSTPTPTRRTQQSNDSESHESTGEQPAKTYASRMRKRIQSDKTAKADSPHKVEGDSSKSTLETKSSRDKALTTFRQAKVEVPSSQVSSVDEEVQKVKNKLYRDSMPAQVRKQLQAQEALAKMQQEEAEAERLAQAEMNKEKRRHRLSLASWVTLASLTLLGIVWLLYAPFFLAFAVEMGWLSESSRNRLDPAASVRSELASKTIEPAKKPLPTAPVQKEADVNAVHYTFYKELPKDVLMASVQPLAVKTKDPMYLELLYLPNEALVQAEKRRLTQKGYVVQMSTVMGKSGQNFVLRMGPFDDQRRINRLKVELQKLGIDAREVSASSVVKPVSESTKSGGARMSQSPNHNSER